MKSPFTGNEMTIFKDWRILSFRKEEFRVLFHVYRCEDTGEQFEDEVFAELNHNQLINQYRAKYRIPFPEEIKAIREMYDLSALKMSKILGFGDNIYRNYEAGEVPNQSNARLIHIVKDAREFKKLIANCPELNDQEKLKLVKKAEEVIYNQKEMRSKNELEQYLVGTHAASSITGFRIPSMEKVSEMVVFFAEKMKPWKTKLNKLLFYADFSMFNRKGISISGLSYVAIPHGPVPYNYESIFEYIANNKNIDIVYTTTGKGYEGEQFCPIEDRKFNSSIFTSEELGMLEEIATRFLYTSTQEIVEISHAELAWINNIDGKSIIDYSYGFLLNN